MCELRLVLPSKGFYTRGHDLEKPTYGNFVVVTRPGDMDQGIPNIINVVNHNDGLASASLNTVTKFFEQIKAVDDLQLQRREMFKLLMEKVPTRGKKTPP